jgi:hypothetical protein
VVEALVEVQALVRTTHSVQAVEEEATQRSFFLSAA